LQRRDPQALAELYDRYGRAAYSLVLRVVRDKSIAEDLVQETFLRVWNRVHSIDPRFRWYRSSGPPSLALLEFPLFRTAFCSTWQAIPSPRAKSLYWTFRRARAPFQNPPAESFCASAFSAGWRFFAASSCRYSVRANRALHAGAANSGLLSQVLALRCSLEHREEQDKVKSSRPHRRCGAL